MGDNIPILLTKEQLLAPIELSINRIQLIQKEAALSDCPDVLREGGFALAWASFENALIESGREMLLEMPQKLPQSDFKISKADIVAGRVLEEAVERCISGLQYKGLREFVGGMFDILSIDEGGALLDIDLGVINEIKESRNLLLHNNLVVNGIYLEKAGSFSRGSNIGDRIPINLAYLNQTTEILTSILKNIRTQLNRKYAKYTRVKAFRDLWAYCFSTPLAIFDQYWTVDNDVDQISYRLPEKARSLSHSESSCLFLWESMWNHDLPLRKHGPKLNFLCLDSNNLDKHLFLIKALVKLQLGK